MLHTHTAKVGEVLLGGFILFVLVDPLIEVGLEEMHFLGVFEQTRPVLVIELLLAQLDLDVLGGVVCLALVDVDLGVELKLEVVRLLECIRVARESQALGLELELQVCGRNIRDRDGQVDEVFGRVGL